MRFDSTLWILNYEEFVNKLTSDESFKNGLIKGV
jgi:hypothetical protein